MNKWKLAPGSKERTLDALFGPPTKKARAVEGEVENPKSPGQDRNKVRTLGATIEVHVELIIGR
jgi:hypothetical protein